MTRCLAWCWILGLGLSIVGQTQAADATPAWKALPGLRVDVITTPQTVTHPIAITVGDEGEIWVLERRQAANWQRSQQEVRYQDGTSQSVDRWQKDSRDVLKRLVDADQNGSFEAAQSVMSDLDAASGVLYRDGWWYIGQAGRVVRRTLVAKGTTPRGLQGSAELLRLPAPTAEQEIIEQELVHGLSGFDQRQRMGLSFSADGCLFIVVGAGDHRAEGADGSRATVLRSGAIFRCLPHGFDLHEVTRGLAAPDSSLAFDPWGRAWQVDVRSRAVPAKAVQLLRVHEGHDYGWRLKPEATDLLQDLLRSATGSVQPGISLPVTTLTGSASSALLWLTGADWPSELRDCLVYADSAAGAVRAVKLTVRNGRFEVSESWDLLTSAPEARFHPQALELSPSGDLLIVDSQSESTANGPVWKHDAGGRVLKLGPAQRQPAKVSTTEPSKRDAKEATSRAAIESLVAAVQVRQPGAAKQWRELVASSRLSKTELSRQLNPAKRDDLSDEATIALLGGLCADQFDATIQMVLAELATRDSPVGFFAAEAFVRRATLETTAPNVDTQIARLNIGVQGRSPELKRSSAAALSKIGQLSRQRDADRIKQITRTLTTAVLQVPPDDPGLFNALARSVEQLGEPAIRQVSMHVTQTHSPSLDAALRALEAMHSRPTARIWEAVLFGDTDHLTVEQQRRLARVYRFIQVDPPVPLTTFIAWLIANENADPAVQCDGWETLLACRTPANADDLAEALTTLHERLSRSKDAAVLERVEKLWSLTAGK